MSSETVVIGRIGRPHGIQGAVHARASGQTLATLRVGETVDVRTREGDVRRLVLAGRSGLADSPILAFEGLSSREDAAVLTGGDIAVDGARVGRPDDPDTFFVREMVGCEVLVGERPLGTVREVIAAPGQRRAGGRRGRRRAARAVHGRRGGRPGRPRAAHRAAPRPLRRGVAVRIDVFTLFPEWFDWMRRPRHMTNAALSAGSSCGASRRATPPRCPTGRSTTPPTAAGRAW